MCLASVVFNYLLPINVATINNTTAPPDLIKADKKKTKDNSQSFIQSLMQRWGLKTCRLNTKDQGQYVEKENMI